MIARAVHFYDGSRSPLTGPAASVARGLLGAYLFSSLGGLATMGRIVEVEAYAADDAASHSFRGQNLRNAAMFGRAGHAYVYRSYGLHWCINITCGREGAGAAVLVRALAPVLGFDAMRLRRGLERTDARRLCCGPGNVCQALGVSRAQDGQDLLDADGSLRLLPGPAVANAEVWHGPRVGIRRATQLAWRFYVGNSRYVSSSRRTGRPIANGPRRV